MGGKRLDWEQANIEAKMLEQGTEPWFSDFSPDRTFIETGPHTAEQRAHLIFNTRQVVEADVEEARKRDRRLRGSTHHEMFLGLDPYDQDRIRAANAAFDEAILRNAPYYHLEAHGDELVGAWRAALGLKADGNRATR
jgi:hypothetical protein